MSKTSILGTLVDQISLEQCIEKIIDSIESNGSVRIVTANPEMIYQAQRDPDYLKTINAADLVVPDGIGVVWAGKILGTRYEERVTGIDLTQRLFAEGHKRGWRIFLLGSRPGVAEQAVRVQSEYFPGLVFDCYHGYFTAAEEHDVKLRIQQFSPDVLLAGLGAPKQEYWLSRNPDLAKVRIGVGGTLDVLAGRVKRAPVLFRRLGLEWLYRLMTEPSRIARQKVLPLYVYHIMRQKLKMK